jgi:hypothetical protein
MDPGMRDAHRGLADVCERAGDDAAARLHRDKAFLGNPLVARAYRGTGTPVELLVIGVATRANVPLETLLDDRIYKKTMLYAEYFDFDAPLPKADLILNAIGDAEASGAVLHDVARALERSEAPVFNAPAAVLATTRAANAVRLATLPGVRSPQMRELARGELLDIAGEIPERYGIAYPLLVRSPGYHNGEHFELVESPSRMPAVLDRLPGERVLVLEYADTRSLDGKIRKYRAIVVDGALYPLHLAVSHRWKIHFNTADMTNNPDHQAEDLRFLQDMEGTLGAPAMAALGRIAAVLGLDYGGIDFGIDRDGAVVVFEANATMRVPVPDFSEQFSYRNEFIERIRNAARIAIYNRARKPA